MNIYQVDAFTDHVFGGNPAAVIPLESWPDDALMQRIAMENNLSETVFFVRTNDGYHIRWFTPAFEIDLCGHATLASAYVIKNYIDPSVEAIRFSTQQVGELRAICKDGMYTLDFPARMPVACSEREAVLNSLGITDAMEVLKSRDYFVVLRDEEAVKNIKPDFALVEQLDSVGVIVTAKGASAEVVSRCFYPGAGIPEDPVTGSAHCNIVPYWCDKLSKTNLFCKQLSTRGGDLWCELVNGRVLMSGHCTEFMQGRIVVNGQW
jgi:PhzF family phenazine biosynthesis protein